MVVRKCDYHDPKALYESDTSVKRKKKSEQNEQVSFDAEGNCNWLSKK